MKRAKTDEGLCGHCGGKFAAKPPGAGDGWFMVHVVNHRPGFFHFKAMEQKLYRGVVTPEQAKKGAATAPVYCSFQCLVLARDKPCDSSRCACKDKTI